MSFLQRIQPFLLSGFLATTATSCPPERIVSSLRGLSEDGLGPASCPVSDLPGLTDDPESLGSTLANLSGRSVDPDSFHLENLDRLRAFEPLCSARQIDRFDGLQESIGARIAAMSPAQIADALEGLYRDAYVYRDSDRTMAAGDSPSQREAKRRLDFWIAAVDQRAYADRDFLNRIWEEKRIRTVMALNSPYLDPLDRGGLELMFRAEPGGDEGLTRLLRERPMEGYTRLFDWLRTYDGRREKFYEEPFMRSQVETDAVIDSHFGRERLLRLGQSVFPAAQVAALVKERGYGPDYRRYIAMSRDALIQHFLEVSMALGPQARPASRRRMVEELMVMCIVFDKRGMDPYQELERLNIEVSVANGLSREDAVLLTRLQAGSVPYTHDRLDDYRARHGLLEEYRNLYTDMLTHPIEDVFAPENQKRYGMWGAILLNRSMTKIPIFLDDLDHIRRDVQTRIFPTMSFGSERERFEFHDSRTAAWFMPSDLGFCGSFNGGMMTTAGLVAFNGRTANDIICSNVELIADLPESLHPDHTLATAIGVFGVITLRSLNLVEEGGRFNDEAWRPGSLLETATHEAAHVYWFRSNFDRDSQRLPMLALNERYAYAEGGEYLENYFLSGFAGSSEAGAAAERFRFLGQVIDTVNDVIGIPSGQKDADYWETRWDAENPARFMIQPADVLRGLLFQAMLEARFGAPSNEELDRAWQLGFDSVVTLLPSQDRPSARDGLARISSSSNTSDSAIFFLQSDPFTRAVNEIRAAFDMMPLISIDMNESDWRMFERSMSRSFVDWSRYRRLPQTPPPTSR